MFIEILEVNGKKYKKNGKNKQYWSNEKYIGNGHYIPECFKDEAQHDRFYDEAFKKYRYYHLRENNKPELMNFEGMQLKLKFS